MRYPFPRPVQYATQIKRSVAGLGLFAAQPIPRKTFVIEYWGKLLNEKQANAAGGKYLFELGNGKTIDGATRQNTARYINHACKPNCEIDIVGNRVYIVTLKNIAAGEEITYDYDTEYFEAYIKPHGCRCGSCVKKASSKK